MVTQKQSIIYYKDRGGKIRRAILSNVKKENLVIYGGQAVNKQLSPPLQSYTEDYDIFSPTPNKSARKVERELDKSYGFDSFGIRPAKHHGTYKIVSKVTKRGVADYSKPAGKIRTIKKSGVRYAHLSYQLARIKKILKDPSQKFRHLKDLETQQRILLNKKMRERSRTKGVNSAYKRWGLNFNDFSLGINRKKKRKNTIFDIP